MIRLILIVTLALLAGACQTRTTPRAGPVPVEATAPRIGASEEARHSFQIEFSEIASEGDVIGRWSLSEDWTGYMGIALELTETEYKYWFYSDVKSSDDPTYPIVGKWELVKGVLSLKPTSEGRLYAKDWVMAKHNGTTGLLDPENIKVLIWHKTLPTNRMLKKVPNDFADWPTLNFPAR